MAERLIVISDMWGAKKGIWATSYLVYLQQYFDVTYYDSQQLAKIELGDDSREQLDDAFLNGGVDKAIAQLMQNEKEPCHYVGFGVGGTIAWQANLQGLPIKSLYVVSATSICDENNNKPGIPTKIVFGDLDAHLPRKEWFDQIEMEYEIIKGFGHDLYTQDVIIKEIAQNLLSLVTNKIKTKAKVIPIRKPLLVS
jgi:dienelactone hydrolase